MLEDYPDFVECLSRFKQVKWYNVKEETTSTDQSVYDANYQSNFGSLMKIGELQIDR